MAIDKTIPNKLQTDMDQRGVNPRAGEMLDAQNVTMSESGRNSAGVIKNVRSTVAATADANNRVVDGDAVTVIGSVSDPQRGYVYWFVADNTGSSQDAIYRQDTSDNTYEIVLKGSFLNFDSGGFVKADVVNAAFQQDGVIQSALYFTDNRNPPRKVNVDRALNGDYVAEGQIQGDIDFSTLVIKGPLTIPPTAFFETDTNYSVNNFREDSFQFAIQYIYQDGEESAISTYSKIAVSNSIKESGIVDVLSSSNSENVCVIDTNWVSGFERTYKTDVKRIRLLGRVRNDGVFYIIDEFNPNESVSREFDGVDRNVYDSALGHYRFYNDGVYSIVSQDTVNKVYDNVPFLAAGQAVSGNRLMYSNYTEGRANNPVSASLVVNYSPSVPSGSSSYHVSSQAAAAITYGGTASDVDDGKVIVDLTSNGFSWPSPNNETSTVPDNTTTRISFDYELISDVYKAGSQVHTISCVGSGGTFDLEFGTSSAKPFPIVLADSAGDTPSPLSVSASYTTQGSQDVEDISDGLKNHLIDTEYESSYVYTATTVTAVASSSTDPGVADGSNAVGTVKFKLVMGFDEIADSGDDGAFTISPYIKSVEVLSHNFSIVESITSQSTNSQLLSTQATYDADTTSNTNNTYVQNASVYSQTPSLVSSFKMGSSHEFGVVYYDKWGRSGNVNKVGGVYVDHTAERTQDYGPASITMSFGSGNNPPDWAYSWQPVYRGMSSFDDFTTYTTGGGFPVKENGTNNLIESDHRIYVSLKTLDIYNDEQGGFRDYSFTEGDILRVISRKEGSTGNVYYPSANDGSPIEFKVLGVEVLVTADNPLVGNDSGHGKHYEGKFLVLQAPDVDGGRQVDVSGSPADLKYQGFDWFSITGSNYPNDSNSTVANWWGYETVVEILSPKKTSTNNVFYEIGERQRANSWVVDGVKVATQHGPAIRIREGDVHFRTISCKSPVYASNSWNVDSDTPKDDWEYLNKVIETRTLSDKQSEVCWSKGRPHVPFENSAEVRRYNGITYSDAYAEDVANLSLSSFNASLANFYSLDSTKGSCNFIGNMKDGYLLGVQENGVARIPVGKDIITSPNQGGIVSLTSNVIGEPFYYMGDFGCNDNPESVLIRDGGVFFVDTSRKKVVRLTGEGLSPVSESGVDSLFKDEYDAFEAQDGSRIVSGYDPEDNQYYVTLRPSGTYGGFTMGYNITGGFWQSRYSFTPDMYSDQNGTMYSALYVDPEGDDNATVFYSHTDEATRNTFYGTAAPSIVRVASNYNPSMVKVFNAVSLEGDSNAWVADPVVTDLNSNAQSKQFVEKEGAYYSEFTRDENGTKHIIGIGTVESVTANTITFVNRVNRNPIPYGAQLRIVDADNNEYDPIGITATDVTFDSFASPNTVNVNGTVNIVLSNIVGSRIVAVSNSSVDGDPVRGHWADITLTNNQTAPFELFCINTHFSPSDQNHSLGQQ